MFKTWLLIESPPKPSAHFKTEHHNDTWNKTTTLNRLQRQKQSLTLKQYNSQILNPLQPRKRAKSLHRTSSSKLNIFQNARTTENQQKRRTNSVTSLMTCTQMGSSSERFMKMNIPKKADSNNKDSNSTNEKKTVEDIMKRLKKKKQPKLRLSKQVQTSKEKLKIVELFQSIQPQLNLQNLAKTQISLSLSRREETESKSIEMQKIHKMQSDLSEKQKYFEKVEKQVGHKVDQMKNMMNNFERTVKAKQQELVQKQRFLEMKERQIEQRLKQKAQSIIETQFKKNIPKLNIQQEDPQVHQVSKQIVRSNPNKQVTLLQATKNIPHDKVIQIPNQNNLSNMLQNVTQTQPCEKGLKKNPQVQIYNQSQSIDLDQIQSIGFEAEQTSKQPPIKQAIDDKTRHSNSKIKTVKQPMSSPVSAPQIQRNNGKPQPESKIQTGERPNLANQQSNNLQKPPQVPQQKENNPAVLDAKPLPQQVPPKSQDLTGQKSRKPSVSQSASSRSKQQTEQARRKRKEEKQKTAQIVKSISRVNELLYFIIEIPHHCSNNMKKKKKYGFKLATLYLLKYVYDKFRYIGKLCQQLLKKKVVTKEYIKEREEENARIKESYQKMKASVYKKELFPSEQCEQYLDENSVSFCFTDGLFIRNFLFPQIKSMIQFYHSDTNGKWLDHQVNLCYYRMFLAVFMLQEIEYDNIVLDTEEQEQPNYMLGQIQKFTENQLKQKMEECYEIFLQLDIN